MCFSGIHLYDPCVIKPLSLYHNKQNRNKRQNYLFLLQIFVYYLYSYNPPLQGNKFPFIITSAPKGESRLFKRSICMQYQDNQYQDNQYEHLAQPPLSQHTSQRLAQHSNTKSVLKHGFIAG